MFRDTTDAFQVRIQSMNEKADFVNQEVRACKSKPVLKIVKQFLIKQLVIFYGGMAQNEYLPKELRFYTASDIPDYDVFSSAPEELATKLADHLVSKGYSFVTVKNAVHEGTFKVSWDFEDVADITRVSPEHERSMRRSAKKAKDGALLCPLHLLKANAYVELAMPKSAMFRWAKVFERTQLLERAFPLKSVVGSSFKELPWELCDNTKLNRLVSKCFAFCKRNNLPVGGHHAVQYYNDERVVSNRHLGWYPRLEVFTINSEKTLRSLRRVLDRAGVEYIVSDSMTEKDTLWSNETNLILRNNVHLISIKEVANKCYSLQRSDTGVLYISLFFVISSSYHALYRLRTSLGIEATISTMVANVRVEDFKAECFGEVRDLLSIKRSKVRKRMPVVFYDPERKK